MRGRIRGAVEPAATLSALSRILVASVVAAAVATLTWWGLDAALGRSLGAQVVSVGLGLAVGTGGYVIACRLLGVRELGSLLALRRGS
jgi:putative peptidoglycan lipid II flippase